jgi:hypothetical protein
MEFRVTAYVSDGLQAVHIIALDEQTAWDTMRSILGRYGEILEIAPSHVTTGE